MTPILLRIPSTRAKADQEINEGRIVELEDNLPVPK